MAKLSSSVILFKKDGCRYQWPWPPPPQPYEQADLAVLGLGWANLAALRPSIA